MSKYIIALDQGTTSSRAVLFSDTLTLIDICQKEFTQIFPKDGWVEHNPEEIWESQWSVFKTLIKKNSIDPKDILTIGITNQRETVVIWDKETGAPIYNAIVWQDRRTAEKCDALKAQGHSDMIQRKTGLPIDPYFSASKIQWLLDTVDGARNKAENNQLLMGTIDTWLIWKLTDGMVHATDVTNASRTMLFNTDSITWDNELLELFTIPHSLLADVKNSADSFGSVNIDGIDIPINGVAGDQHAATFGQSCFNIGDIKNTYGTGCFMLMNTGTQKITSTHGLLSTIAWKIGDEICYALEGSIFIAGAAIQWLRDGLKIIQHAEESEKCAYQANPESSVVVVPAFTGLGAPYWDSYARGAMFGITRDTGSNEIIKATLEAIAYQSKDIIEAMILDSGIAPASLSVDGGACANNFLMQFQSDMLQCSIHRPKIIESTALGAAALAGIHSRLWTIEKIKEIQTIETTFTPKMPIEKSKYLYNNWKNCVNKIIN